MAAVYDILTPDQKTMWNGFRLYRQAMQKYKKLGLSEDQAAKVRGLADGAAEDVDPTDEKGTRRP